MLWSQAWNRGSPRPSWPARDDPHGRASWPLIAPLVIRLCPLLYRRLEAALSSRVQRAEPSPNGKALWREAGAVTPPWPRGYQRPRA